MEPYEALEFTLDPISYKCPFCLAVHTKIKHIYDDVVVSECCDVSESEEAHPESGIVRLKVRIPGLVINQQ